MKPAIMMRGPPGFGARGAHPNIIFSRFAALEGFAAGELRCSFGDAEHIALK